MNEAEKKLFIITDDDLLDFSSDDIGEYVKDDGGMIEVGPVTYDPRKADPPTVIRENVLEKNNERRREKD